jgi:hypothetical protein
MESVENLKRAMRQAEDDHAEARRQLAEAQNHAERLRAEMERTQRAYIRALEQEVDRPRPAPAAQPGQGQWDEPGPDFQNLVIQAGSRVAADRVVAQRALDRMGPKAIDPLLAMLSRETARWEHRINVVCGVLVALTVAAMLQLPALAGFPAGYWLMLLCIPLLVLYAKPFGPHKRAAEALARIDDARVIGPLVTALDMDDPVVVPAAAEALRRLLHRVRPDTDCGLTEAHWQTLFRAVDRTRDEPLAIAALRAAMQAGDERVIPLAAPVADGKGIGAISGEARREAQYCLQLLADQSLRGRPGRTLLRAVSDPEKQDSLLRPVAASTESDPQALLRPSQPEEAT